MKENDLLTTQTSLIEVYLLEYCEVNNIKESDLHSKLTIKTQNSSIIIYSTQNSNRIEIGIRQISNSELRVFGLFLLEREKYPKTNNIIKALSE